MTVDYIAKFIFKNRLVVESNDISTYAWTGDIDDVIAVGSAVSSVATMPARHLKTTRKQERLRMSNTDKFMIRITFNALYIFSGAVLMYHNLSGASKVRWKLWTDDLATHLIYDSGAYNPIQTKPWGGEPWGVFVWGEIDKNTQQSSPHYFDSVAAKIVDIYIDDETSPEAYVELGHMVLGPISTPGRNFMWGRDGDGVDKGRVIRASDGSIITQEDIDYTEFQGSFKLETSDLSGLKSNILAQKKKPFFADFYPANSILKSTYSGLWSVEADSLSDKHLSYNHHEISIQFTRN